MTTNQSLPTEAEIFAALTAKQTPEAAALLRNARVAVAGCGGLGSNVSMYLARMGVGHLHLIDFDRVELSNLNRQHYFLSDLGKPKAEALAAHLHEVNPYLDLQVTLTRVTEDNLAELFRDADIICEAFDRAEAKAMLVSGARSLFPAKPLIAASGLAGFGPANEIRTRRVMTNFYLAGDGVSDLSLPLCSARVAMTAAHEANQIARLILGLEK